MMILFHIWTEHNEGSHPIRDKHWQTETPKNVFFTKISNTRTAGKMFKIYVWHRVNIHTRRWLLLFVSTMAMYVCTIHTTDDNYLFELTLQVKNVLRCSKEFPLYKWRYRQAVSHILGIAWLWNGPAPVVVHVYRVVDVITVMSIML